MTQHLIIVLYVYKDTQQQWIENVWHKTVENTTYKLINVYNVLIQLFQVLIIITF